MLATDDCGSEGSTTNQSAWPATEQLDQTRQDIQRAAEAAAQGSASQALAAGTRAQNQLQEMRDQFRNQNSSQFSEDLRDMRNQARELAREQQKIVEQLANTPKDEPRSLSGPSKQSGLLEQLADQQQRITNLVAHATEVSRDAEVSEPLLSRELHDTLRKFAQDTSRDVKQLQEQLLTRGMMTRSLMDKLRDTKTPDATKLLETTAEMLRMEFTPQARDSAARAGADLEALRQGVERAAESVLGNDTEALQMAQDELRELTDQLQREMAGASGSGTNEAGTSPEGRGNANRGTNAVASAAGAPGTNTTASAAGATATNGVPGLAQGQQGSTNQFAGRGPSDRQPEQQNAQARQGQPGDGQQNGERGNSQQVQADGNQQSAQGQGRETGGNQLGREQATQLAQNDAQQRQPGEGNRNGGNRTRRNLGGARSGGAEGADLSGSLRQAIDTMFDEDYADQAGPLIGEGYASWSDRLRDVEEMVELPDLRNELSRVRDRARQMRQDFKRDHKKPDWAVVRLQVVSPLVEVSNRIAEELARRESREALVPIDRDPVPTRYSDLVRRYYEQLGK